MTKVKVTQVISKSGATKRQIANLQSLGIRRINHSIDCLLSICHVAQSCKQGYD